MDYEEIKADVEKVLSEKRFTHSVGVAKKAVELAKKYSDDKVKNMINGVLDKVYHEKIA